MVKCTDTNWAFLIMIAGAIVRLSTPAFCCTSMRLRHIKLFVSPTFPVRLDAEVSIACTFSRLSTAVIENKIKWIISVDYLKCKPVSQTFSMVCMLTTLY